jgi:hypothetical protein
MKKLKLIGVTSAIVILGVTGIGISATLTSCSEKPNLTINTYADFEKYFASANHHDEFNDPVTFTRGDSQSDQLIEYFITEKRLTPNNILYSQLYKSVEFLDSYQHSPMNLKIEMNGNRISIKTTSNFEIRAINQDVDFQYIKSYKGFTSEYELSTNGYYFSQKGKQEVDGEVMNINGSYTLPLSDAKLAIYNTSDNMFFLDIYNKNDDTNCGYLPNLSFGPTG